VQRMTGLSSMFVLLGLAGYLAARQTLPGAPRRALLLMGASLTIATSLAVLSKESGVLLPLYVFVLECTLLKRPDAAAPREWQLTQALFVWFPSVVVAAVLIMQLPYDDSMVLRRDFNAWERVLTQAGILWTYLIKAVAGLPGQLGVYQPDPAVARGLFAPLTLLATAAWTAVVAVAIRWRRKLPLFAFAALWFLAGHVLESTVLPLELYFEHRNYLPIAGPVIAVVAFLLMHSDETRKISRFAIPALVVLNLVLLFGVTSLHGNTSVSARYWAQKHPDSYRAVLNLGRVQLIEEGLDASLATVNDYVSRNPQDGYLYIYVLDASCQHFPDRVSPADVDAIAAAADQFRFSFLAAELLSGLHATSVSTSCAAVDVDSVVRLAEAIRANPRFSANAEYGKLHFVLMATIERTAGNLDGAIANLEKALEHQMTPQVVQIVAISLAEAQQYDRAREVARAAGDNIPLNPFRAWQWRRSIDQIYNYVDAVERKDRMTK
ncbi:MAG: hypothetical protein AAFN50_10875, partial [Pseudomonadota bacterium]